MARRAPLNVPGALTPPVAYATSKIFSKRGETMSSSGWLWLFVICLVIVGVVAAVKLSSKGGKVSGQTAGVDLDKLIDVFQKSGGKKDVKRFEAAVNKAGLYKGGYVTVGWGTGKPSIVGFVDRNGNKVYDRGTDTFVFRLQIERRAANRYRVIASDGYYYRYHPIYGTLATMYLADSLMWGLWYRHYSVYGMAPRMVYRYRYVPRGYYRMPRYRRTRTSYRRGSWGGRSRSGRWGK